MTEHQNSITSIIFSKDDTIMISSDSGGKIVFWTSFIKVYEINLTKNSSIIYLHISDDNKYLYSFTDKLVVTYTVIF